MTKTSIPCFDYKRAALFIDDNQRHLTRITTELDGHLPHSVFSNPQKILDYIQAHGRPKRQFKLESLYLEIENPDRFNEPALVVEDYAMPGTNMNGFELCAEIKQLSNQLNIPSPKIILLSGQAGEDIAQEGFKKGYIDKYISKNDPQCSYKLDKAIQELQMQFSIEQSAQLFQELSAQSDFCLNHDHFIQAFKQICQEHAVVEYYLLNESGDFLLAQFDGSLLCLKGGVIIKEPDLAPVQREKIMSLYHYLEHVWPIK